MSPEKEHTYGLIAYVPNLGLDGHILIIGGLDMAGTQAAGTFLQTPDLIQAVLKSALQYNDSLFKLFELLLKAG